MRVKSLNGLFVILACCAILQYAHAQNPFELLHRDSTLIQRVDPAMAADNIPSIQKPKTSQGQERISEQETDLQQQLKKKLATNPFDITRIPIPPSSENPVLQDSVEEKAVEIRTAIEAGEGLNTIQYVLIFLVVLLVLTLVVNLNRDLYQQLSRAALNENFSSLLFRERKYSSTFQLYSIAYIIFFLNGGLFLYLLTGHFDALHIPKSYVLCVAIVTLIYLVRHMSMLSISRIFPISKEIRQFNFNILLFNILLGVILIPVNLFLVFGPEGFFRPFIYLGLAIFLIMYLMRQFRGFQIGSRLVSQHIFHFFIYLCTIEILPIAVLLKFFL